MPYSKDKGMMGPLMQQPNQKYYIKKRLHWKFQLSAEDTIYSLNLFCTPENTWKWFLDQMEKTEWNLVIQ